MLTYRNPALMSFRTMVLVTAVFALTLTVSDVLGVRLCGKQLADMLDLVCYGRGFHWRPRDRGVPSITKRSALQYLTSSQGQGESGVVAECCRQSCSLADMESYCAASHGVVFPTPTNGPLTRELANELLRTGQTSSTTTPPPSTPPATEATSTVSTTTRTWLPYLPFRRIGNGSKYFFVRPVGPAATRVPTLPIA